MKRIALMSLPLIVLGLVLTGVAKAAGGGDPTRFVSTAGSDTSTCTNQMTPCRTVQHAVSVAGPGDTIQIAAGLYIEQVTISKSLHVQGAGQDRTIIQAPASKSFDAAGYTDVVEVTGSTTTAQIQNLTVSGPGDPGGGNNCAQNAQSLDYGVRVDSGATLQLQQSAVRNVFDQPQSGCQRGQAISIGSACFTCANGVGHATLDHVLVDDFQKDGVAVRGPGSTLDMHDSTVDEMPQPQIASNGIEVLTSAVANIHNNWVTGDECNLSSACGPNVSTEQQATGILVSGPGSGTQVTNNNVSQNDIGIYTDTGIPIMNNNTSANRDAGIFIDMGATGGHFNNNITDGSNDARESGGGYGIYVNSGVGGNTFQGDQGFGNGVFDFYDNGNSATANTFGGNHCGTAFPDKAHWACM